MLLGSVCVWALGASSELFLLKRASDLGVPASLVPVVWLGVSLAKSGSAMMAGRLADSWHPRWALAAGWLLFAIAYGGLAMTAQIFFALPLIGLIGIAYGLAEPAERALVALKASTRQPLWLVHAGARPDGITSRPVDGMALAARLFGSLMGTRHDGRALRNCLPALHLYRPTFDRITDDLRLGPGFFCHFQTLANIGEGIVGVLLILQ